MRHIRPCPDHPALESWLSRPTTPERHQRPGTSGGRGVLAGGLAADPEAVESVRSDGRVGCASASWARLKRSPRTAGTRSARPSGGRCSLACCCAQASCPDRQPDIGVVGRRAAEHGEQLGQHLRAPAEEGHRRHRGKMLVYRAPGYMLRIAPGMWTSSTLSRLPPMAGPRWPTATRSGPRCCSARPSGCGAGRCSPTCRRHR